MPRKKSLGAEFASLLDPTPTEVNLDDDWEQPQVDTMLDQEESGSDHEQSEKRLHMRSDISITSGKYKGTPSSREKFGLTSLQDEESPSASEIDSSINEDSSSEDSSEDPYHQAMQTMSNAAFKEAEAIASRQEEGKGITLVKNVEKDLQKAKHTQHQQKIWDAFLKLRIKEQRSLSIANRLPQHDILDDFCDFDEEIGESRDRICSSIQEIMSSLLLVGSELRSQNTKLRETLPEEVQDLMTDGEPTKQSRKRKRSHFACSDEESDPVSYYWGMVEEYTNSPSVFYQETIDYWQKKTSLSAKLSQTKFKAINQSIYAQVEAVMEAPDKLIERTQKKKAVGRILGKDLETDKDSPLDPEIFDDSSFYQGLLKSLLEQDSSADPTESARSWLKARDQNNSTKKVYSSKLSKDRVLKFNVHEKLVDFVTPTDQRAPGYTDDLFNNLFK